MVCCFVILMANDFERLFVENDRRLVYASAFAAFFVDVCLFVSGLRTVRVSTVDDIFTLVMTTVGLSLVSPMFCNPELFKALLIPSFYGWHDDRVREYCCPLLLTSPFWLGGGAAPFLLGFVLQSCCVVVWGSIPIYLSFRAAWEETKDQRESIQNKAGFKPNMSFRVADDDEDNGESFPEPPAKIMHVHVNLGTDPSCSCGMDFECTDHGVLLTKVSWNMPFSRADLRTGDLITAMNGHDVTGSNMTAANLAQIKAATQPDTAGIFLLAVDFVREGGGQSGHQNIDNGTTRRPRHQSFVTQGASFSMVSHAEELDVLPSYEEMLRDAEESEKRNNSTRASLGRAISKVMHPDAQGTPTSEGGLEACVDKTNRIFPFSLCSNAAVIASFASWFSGIPVLWYFGYICFWIALPVYYIIHVLPLCCTPDLQPEEWSFLDKDVMSLDDAVAALERDKKKKPVIIFSGETWHMESVGQGKKKHSVRRGEEWVVEPMRIPGYTDRTNTIPVEDFAAYDQIKLTIRRSWEAEEGSETFFEDERKNFKVRTNTDKCYEYAELFNLGTVPVYQLVKNSKGGSWLFNKPAYIVCAVFFLAWPWRFYFEIMTVRATLHVRKVLNDGSSGSQGGGASVGKVQAKYLRQGDSEMTK